MSSSSSDDTAHTESEEGGGSQPPEPARPARHAGEAGSGKAKEKKRVGFASDGRQNRNPEGLTVSVGHASLRSAAPDSGEDRFYASDSPNAGSSSLAPAQIAGNRQSFNREELTAALTEILAPELTKTRTPPAARPVLRKHSSYSGPETEPSDPAIRSEAEASRIGLTAWLTRLKRLHQPGAGLASEEDVSRETSTPLGSSGFASATGINHGAVTTGFNMQSASSAGARPRALSGLHDVAQNLVRMHSLRKTAEAMPQEVVFTSGIETPVPDDLEYVPRPQAYRGRCPWQSPQAVWLR